MSETPKLRADILGQISLMQSFVSQLPATTIPNFVCNGLSDIPGVDKITAIQGESFAEQNDKKNHTKTFKIRHQDRIYLSLQFKILSYEVFTPYLPYIENFCNMLGLIFNNEEQKKAEHEHYKLLFENTGISIWDQDRTEYNEILNSYKTKGIKDIKAYMAENTSKLFDLYKSIKLNKVNQATLKLFKVENAQEIDQHYNSFLQEESIGFLLDETDHFYHGKTEFKRNKTFYRKNGDKIETIISIRIPKPAESFAHIPLNIYDISDLKKTEKALSLSKFKLRAIIDNVPSFIFVKNTNGEFLDINKAAASALGKTPEEIVGHKHSDITTNKEQAQRLTNDDIEVIKDNKQKLISEELFITEAGKEMWIQTIKSPFPQEIFGQKALIGTATDITELKHSQQTAHKAKIFAETLIDTANALIVTLDTEGKIKRFNKYAETLTGYSKEEVLNKKWMDIFICKEDKQRIVKVFKTGLDNIEKITNYENNISTKSGQTPLIRWNNSLLYDTDSKHKSILCIGIDITEQKQAEQNLLATNEELRVTTEALKDKNKELEEALLIAQKSKELEIANNKLENAYKEIKAKQDILESLNKELHASHQETVSLNEELHSTNEELLLQREKLKKALKKLKQTQSVLIQSEKMASVGVLTAGIAHEINNPLNFIQGGNTALKNTIEDELPEHSEKLMPLIGMIATGIERTTSIVKSLNRFNRRSENKDEYCNIHSIIDDCLTILHNKIKHTITVDKEYEKEGCAILGNEGKLHQVFLNLLTNAIQSIEDKGVISITTTCSDDKIKIEIKDNGRGIPKSNLGKIFDPFFTTKKPGEGTGLGLSITYNIVKDHNGWIFLKSKQGEGTKVTVILPTGKTARQVKTLAPNRE